MTTTLEEKYNKLAEFTKTIEGVTSFEIYKENENEADIGYSINGMVHAKGLEADTSGIYVAIVQSRDGVQAYHIDQPRGSAVGYFCETLEDYAKKLKIEIQIRLSEL